jgi:hypothetical protein
MIPLTVITLSGAHLRRIPVAFDNLQKHLLNLERGAIPGCFNVCKVYVGKTAVNFKNRFPIFLETNQ